MRRRSPENVAAALDQYVVEATKVQLAINDVYRQINAGRLLTFDWTTTRDATLPDLYTVTGIFEQGLGASRKTDFTMNAAGSFYRRPPDSAARAFKSFDLTFDLEHPIAAPALPNATASVTAKYSYLPNDTVAPISSGSTGGTATTITSTVAGAAPKGNIVVVRFKLTIPVKNGVKVPISVTASNRTELIKERDVRASVALTFDLDAFLAGKAK